MPGWDPIGVALKEVPKWEKGRNQERFLVYTEGRDTQFWCAEFVSFCAYTAGMKNPKVINRSATRPKTASCPTGYVPGDGINCWYRHGIEDKILVANKIIDGVASLYSYEGPHGPHIGWVEECNPNQGYIITVDGNSTNGLVYRNRRDYDAFQAKAIFSIALTDLARVYGWGGVVATGSNDPLDIPGFGGGGTGEYTPPGKPLNQDPLPEYGCGYLPRKLDPVERAASYVVNRFIPVGSEHV